MGTRARARCAFPGGLTLRSQWGKLPGHAPDEITHTNARGQDGALRWRPELAPDRCTGRAAYVRLLTPQRSESIQRRDESALINGRGSAHSRHKRRSLPLKVSITGKLPYWHRRRREEATTCRPYTVRASGGPLPLLRPNSRLTSQKACLHSGLPTSSQPELDSTRWSRVPCLPSVECLHP